VCVCGQISLLLIHFMHFIQKLISRGTVHEKLTVAKMKNKFPALFKPDFSLSRSRKPYSEVTESSPHLLLDPF
jgi:hypothetical protein